MNIYNERDSKGQEKVVPILEDLFSGCTINLEQHIEDSGEIDIFMTATTKNNREYYYAIECKDREYRLSDFDDWIIETRKYRALKQASIRGYRPIYINTFPDGEYLIWNLNLVEPTERVMKTKRTTVEDTGKVSRLRYLFDKNKYTASGTTK